MAQGKINMKQVIHDKCKNRVFYCECCCKNKFGVHPAYKQSGEHSEYLGMLCSDCYQELKNL